MFRKLMRMETEAVVRHAIEIEHETDFGEGQLRSFAGELPRCVPSLPQRFGVCAGAME